MLAVIENEDVILVQITSKNYADKLAIALTQADFESGSLPVESFVRPGKIFTASANIIEETKGTISQEKHGQVIRAITALISAY